jgi:hypothetical protein
MPHSKSGKILVVPLVSSSQEFSAPPYSVCLTRFSNPFPGTNTVVAKIQIFKFERIHHEIQDTFN